MAVAGVRFDPLRRTKSLKHEAHRAHEEGNNAHEEGNNEGTSFFDPRASIALPAPPGVMAAMAVLLLWQWVVFASIR